MMKHKFIGLLLIIALSLPVIQSQAVENAVEPLAETPAIEEVSERQINQLDEDIIQPTEPESSVNKIQYKQPIGKRTLIKLFLKAMIAVGISCVVLYAGLTAYNRLRGVVIETAAKTPDGETPLTSPDSLESAVRIFLEKTKWG